jgi:acyl carrier protein
MGETSTQTTDQLRTFIIKELSFDGSPDELTDDYPLIDRGVLDSLGIFQVVSFIEGELGVAIQDEELVRDNFGTLRDIGALVESKRS